MDNKFSNITAKYKYNPSNFAVGSGSPKTLSSEARLKELEEATGVASTTTQINRADRKMVNGSYRAPGDEQRMQETREKIAKFLGGEKIAKGLGQAMAQKENSKLIEETQNTQIKLAGDLQARIKEKKAAGQDTTKLEQALEDLNADIQSFGTGAEDVLNPEEITGKEVVGDALKLATTVVGAGTLPGQVGKVAKAETFIKGAAQGLKTGAATGGGFGAASGAAEALLDNKSGGEVVENAAVSGLAGIVVGGVVGSVLGGASGALKGRQLRNEIMNAQVKTGQKVPKNIVEYTPKQQKAIEIAKTQGFDETDIDFMTSMNAPDKVKAQKMIDLAQKASVNKRTLERPIDVVGDSMVDRIKFIETHNKEAGKAVDTAAKALKGKTVDVESLRARVVSSLEDAGVSLADDGTLDFSQSVFKNTPSVQNELQKVIKTIPDGSDAYQAHIFKKSLDEVLDFGTGGEGLKGKSANILKSWRNATDEALDAAFEEYNKANTDFKITREALDQASDLFGKKVGIKSKERGGQLLRSVFSNNTQRPRVLQLVEQLDLIAKQYGGKFDDNLVDQALFTEILEDVYGTQATTSLQGQVERAMGNTQAVIEGVKDPIRGLGKLFAKVVEKTQGISDDNKKRVLDALLK